jgi:hypothetical protein
MTKLTQCNEIQFLHPLPINVCPIYASVTSRHNHRSWNKDAAYELKELVTYKVCFDLFQVLLIQSVLQIK